jgi:hypothetical protein
MGSLLGDIEMNPIFYALYDRNSKCYISSWYLLSGFGPLKCKLCQTVPNSYQIFDIEFARDKIDRLKQQANPNWIKPGYMSVDEFEKFKKEQGKLNLDPVIVQIGIIGEVE